VTYLLTNAADFEPCWPVMGQVFGDVRPACTAMVVGLVDSRMKIEIEVTVLRKARAVARASGKAKTKMKTQTKTKKKASVKVRRKK
jgi:hypothetical protein